MPPKKRAKPSPQKANPEGEDLFAFLDETDDEKQADVVPPTADGHQQKKPNKKTNKNKNLQLVQTTLMNIGTSNTLVLQQNNNRNNRNDQEEHFFSILNLVDPKDGIQKVSQPFPHNIPLQYAIAERPPTVCNDDGSQNLCTATACAYFNCLLETSVVDDLFKWANLMIPHLHLSIYRPPIYFRRFTFQHFWNGRDKDDNNQEKTISTYLSDVDFNVRTYHSDVEKFKSKLHRLTDHSSSETVDPSSPQRNFVSLHLISNVSRYALESEVNVPIALDGDAAGRPCVDIPKLAPLALDIDADAYDGVLESGERMPRCRARFCCQGRSAVCSSCWKIIACGCELIDMLVGEYQPPSPILLSSGVKQNQYQIYYTFSGRRGVHIFIRDKWLLRISSSPIYQREALMLLTTGLLIQRVLLATEKSLSCYESFYKKLNERFEQIYADVSDAHNCFFRNPQVAGEIRSLIETAINYTIELEVPHAFFPLKPGSSIPSVDMYFPGLFVPKGDNKYVIDPFVYYHGLPRDMCCGARTEEDDLPPTDEEGVNVVTILHERRDIILGPRAVCRNLKLRKFIQLNMLGPRIDYQAIAPSHPVRMPWGIHPGTGAVNVPLTLNELWNLDPQRPVVANQSIHYSELSDKPEWIKERTKWLLMNEKGYRTGAFRFEMPSITLRIGK